MRFLSLGWIERRKDGRDAIGSEVDHLAHRFGVNAYEEARRRRRESEDLSSARYWSAVKSEIGRNILDQCDEGDFLDRLEASLIASDLSRCVTGDRGAENRVPSAATCPEYGPASIDASNSHASTVRRARGPVKRNSLHSNLLRLERKCHA